MNRNYFVGIKGLRVYFGLAGNRQHTCSTWAVHVVVVESCCWRRQRLWCRDYTLFSFFRHTALTERRILYVLYEYVSKERSRVQLSITKRTKCT